MAYSWLALVPPVVVICVTILTRSVIISLITGIFTACLIATSFNPLAALWLAVCKIASETHISGIVGKGSVDNMYVFCFLLLLGMLIQLMNHSGGIRAYTRWLLSFIKTPQAAQRTSLILSTTLFIDDYVNNLTVSAIIRPITDHFKIARAKLAFLLNSMSGPLCLLIPASSWVAFILAQMQASGIGLDPNSLIVQDPFFAYIAVLPFLLYPLLIVFTAWFIVSGNFSFGLMRHYEDIARKTGNLYGGKEPLVKQEEAPKQFHGTLFDFIMPISTFIGVFIIGIFYSGNSIFFGGNADFMHALQQANPFWALFMASLVAVTSASLLFIYHNRGHGEYIYRAFIDGFMLMKNSMILLLLAWTLSTLLKNDLQTGSYVASLLPTDRAYMALLPLLIFVFGTIISASIGSVWATIALMLPIVVPLYVNLATVASLTLAQFYPLLGALFSGAVAGSHFSPITDAMITTSFSAGCYHLDHVRTQMSYALHALLGAAAGYAVLIALPFTCTYGFMVLCSLSVGFAVTTSSIVVRSLLQKRYEK